MTLKRDLKIHDTDQAFTSDWSLDAFAWARFGRILLGWTTCLLALAFAAIVFANPYGNLPVQAIRSMSSWMEISDFNTRR